MPKYKVGDIAALFPKPEPPTTESGKKLITLFHNFHHKNRTFNSQPKHIKEEQEEKQNKETFNAENISKNKQKIQKKRKRNFSELDTSNFEINVKKQKNKKVKQNNFHQSPVNAAVSNKSFKNKMFIKVKNDNVSFMKKKVTHENKLQKNIQNINFMKKSKANQRKNKTLPETCSETDNKHSTEISKSYSDDVCFPRQVKEAKKIENAGKNMLEKNVIKVKNNSKDLFKSDVSDSEKHESQLDFGRSISADSDEEKGNSDSELRNEIKNIIKESKIIGKKSEQKDKVSSNKNVMIENDNELLSDDENESNLKESIKDKAHFTQKHVRGKLSDVKNDKVLPIHSKKNILPQCNEEKSFKKVPKTPEEEKEILSRTIFVGNLPVNMPRKHLKKLFSTFGTVENVRIRGIVPVKITLPKRLAFIRQEFHKEVKSQKAFVTFAERTSATNALTMNGKLYEGHHITVDYAATPGQKKLCDSSLSVFVGNLPFNVEDEVMWTSFANFGPVASVRIIRDRETGVGKGFGYVTFKDVASKRKALSADDMEISGRKLRIKVVENQFGRRRISNGAAKRQSTLKSRAVRLKKKQERVNKRKTLKKIINHQKMVLKKKKIAQLLQK